jgi:hypothetical protein
LAHLDVFTFNVDIERKEQAYHFYTMGLGLCEQGYFVEIDTDE